MDGKFVARFWSRVERNGSVPEQAPELGPCWEWRASLYRNGYGQLGRGRTEKLLAHRVAWEIAHGPPGALWVLHRCDNRRCVNPAHLFLGTQLDNMRDAKAKGRHVHIPTFGERNGRCKFSDSQVGDMLRLRSSGETSAAVCAAFGVSRSYLSKLLRGTHRATRFHP